MPKKKGGKVLAVVEIGSSMVRMHVSQLKQGVACPLDRLEYPLELSREIRETGKLSMETVRELTGILHGFRAAMTEYGVESCRVYLTAPIQRAENCGFVMGQIRIRTKLEPAPLDGREEQLLLTWKLLSALNLPEAFLQEQGLLVLPGTGALGLTVVNGKNIRLCQSVPVTWPMLSNLRLSAEEAVEEFGEVVEEFVHAAFVKASLYQWKKPAAFAAVIGPESAEVCRMAGAKEESGLLLIEGERLRAFLEEVLDLPPEKMAETYHLPQLDAPGVYAAAASLREVLGHTQAQTVLASPHSLATCMVEHLVPETRAALNDHVAKGALGCAKAMAGRFDCDMVHGELVRSFARRLFEKTKRLHGLTARWCLYLELACLLHDCGSYVDGRDRMEFSRDLLRILPLYGLSREEQDFVAGILDEEEDALPVARMRALFLLADALDCGRRQKLRELNVKIDAENFTVSVTCDENLFLERRAFLECAEYFQEVFGLRPGLAVRSTLL